MIEPQQALILAFNIVSYIATLGPVLEMTGVGWLLEFLIELINGALLIYGEYEKIKKIIEETGETFSIDIFKDILRQKGKTYLFLLGLDHIPFTDIIPAPIIAQFMGIADEDGIKEVLQSRKLSKQTQKPAQSATPA